jgi:hypothetical protein
MDRQAVLNESRAIPRVAPAVKDAVGRTDTTQLLGPSVKDMK